MKLLFDHNVSFRLVVALESSYPNSQHVSQLGMSAASDTTVWDYARDHGFVIVSKDSDFYYRSMLLSHPPKAVWIRLGNCTTTAICDLLRARHADMIAFEQDTATSFLILP